MAKLSTAHLKPNPFTTYRDVQTGQWLVIPAQKATVQGVMRSHQPSEHRESSPLEIWITQPNLL